MFNYFSSDTLKKVKDGKMQFKDNEITILCCKSKLKLIDLAYTDYIEFNESDKRTVDGLIDEITWKLECAIGNYEDGADDFYTKRDFTYTKKFLEKIKKIRQEQKVVELLKKGWYSQYKGRGGKREGAGRPKGTTKAETKKMYSFRLSEDEEKAVRELLKKMRNR